MNLNEFPPLPSMRKANQISPMQRVAKWNKNANAKADNVTEAALDRLPTELLLQILDYIPRFSFRFLFEGDNTQTLSSLSRVNRRFNGLVMNELYREYKWPNADPYLFLRTMASAPAIGANIKMVQLPYALSMFELPTMYPVKITDRAIIKAGFKALNIPRWKEWATACNDCYTSREPANLDMLLTAIIMHTPNLETLFVHEGHQRMLYRTPKWVEVIRNIVSGNSMGNVHGFKHLRSIEVDIAETKLRDLVFVMRLPSLRSLKLTGLVEVGKRLEKNNKTNSYPAWCWPLTPATIAVEELSLHGFVDAPILAGMIASCKRLRCFKYTHSGEAWEGNMEAQLYHAGELDMIAFFNYTTLTTALQRHEQFLECLKVHLQVDKLGYSVPLLHSMGTLRGFRSLKDLDIMLSAFGVVNDGSLLECSELLPPSLTSLRLRLDAWLRRPASIKLLYRLKDLASSISTCCPSLPAIDVKSYPRYRLDWTTLEDTFDAAGIPMRMDSIHGGYLDDSEEEESDEESLWSNDS